MFVVAITFMAMDTLPERLVWLRTTIGVSARELSARAGLSSGMWGLLESGEKDDPRGSTLGAIAESTGTGLDWLMKGKGEAPDADDVRAASDAARRRIDAPPTPEASDPLDLTRPFRASHAPAGQ